MREIRFRAWDKNNQKMWEWKEILEAWGSLDIVEIITGEKGFELMQYTGLCDVNGKEIFESDVLKQKKGRWTGKGTVCFREGVFWWDRECGGSEELYIALNNDEVEVVGNIYEN